MSTVTLGKAGEDRAVSYLEGEGFRIIQRNFRTRRGEVDIIAQEGDTLVFIEVKAWNTLGIETMEHSIDARKIYKIIETAKIFLSRNREYNSMAVRFDLVFVSGGSVQHLASAFTERV
ncbi:YraN family protein [Treponema sp.]